MCPQPDAARVCPQPRYTWRARVRPRPRYGDLFLTHDAGETNTLYVNDGKGAFEDRTDITGLAAGSLASTGIGTGWVTG